MKYATDNIDVLFGLIERRPGLTQVELAEAMFGDTGYQQRVNQDCTLLERRGLVEARETPMRYYPKAPAA